MITNDDIVKLSQVFATKQELQQMREEMSTKVQMNRVIEGMDKVVGELKSMREEHSAHQIDHDRINERLTAIEKVPAVAHDLHK